jgi:hypothetical protein
MKFFAKVKKETQIHRNWWYERRTVAMLHDISFHFDTNTKEYVSKELDPLHTKIASQYPYIQLEMISDIPISIPVEVVTEEVTTQPTEDSTPIPDKEDSTPIPDKEDTSFRKPTSRKRLSMEEVNG